MKQFSLINKAAVITGASGILGRTFCRGLLEAGADIAMIDIDTIALDTLADELKGTYRDRRITVHCCDVSEPDQVKCSVQEIASIHGRIDILHNNAATKTENLDQYFQRFEDYTLGDWRKVMSVNLDGMFLMAQAVGNVMLSSCSRGSIIQTSSIYGLLAPDNRIYEGSLYMGTQINTPAVYAVSKSGVIGLSNYLATYWANKGIRVNTIVPGGVESGQNEIFKQKYSSRIPMQRMAHADEMVGTLVYLASDASSYVTGQTFPIDGGLSTW